MRHSLPLLAVLFTVVALSAAGAQELSAITLPDETAAGAISLPADFTGSGGVGTQADPSGGGMVVQMIPASDTGISNAPSDFHYTRAAGH